LLGDMRVAKGTYLWHLSVSYSVVDGFLGLWDCKISRLQIHTSEFRRAVNLASAEVDEIQILQTRFFETLRLESVSIPPHKNDVTRTHYVQLQWCDVGGPLDIVGLRAPDVRISVRSSRLAGGLQVVGSSIEGFEIVPGARDADEKGYTPMRGTA